MHLETLFNVRRLATQSLLNLGQERSSVLSPDRLAATIFSLTPPIGKIRPIKVSSLSSLNFHLVGYIE